MMSQPSYPIDSKQPQSPFESSPGKQLSAHQNLPLRRDTFLLNACTEIHLECGDALLTDPQ